MESPIHRRSFVLGAGAAALLALLARPGAALAEPKLNDAIVRAIGDATPAAGGPIKLDIPALAENGATVPFTVSVESLMTDEDHVASVHIFAGGNPRPDIASYFFTPASGRARVTSRMRLNQSQDVVAVAQMKDGRAYLTRAFVKVTVGGCDS